MTITDSIKIKAPPEKIFSFLIGLKDTESYKAWYPDHVVMRWIKGEPFTEGSIAYFEEYLHGKIHKEQNDNYGYSGEAQFIRETQISKT